MAILDINTLLSDSVAITSTGTTYSDLLNYKSAAVTTSKDAPLGVNSDAAKGNPLLLWARVDQTFDSGGAGTLTATLQTATDEAFTSPVDLVTSPAKLKAALQAGDYILPQTVPYGGLGWYRIKYVVAAAAMTAGKVTAGITMGHQSNG
tara:strand:- start:311 stop:757 length:447 start_codon:yes stop_codon:yes gene_type:complete